VVVTWQADVVVVRVLVVVTCCGCGDVVVVAWMWLSLKLSRCHGDCNMNALSREKSRDMLLCMNLEKIYSIPASPKTNSVPEIPGMVLAESRPHLNSAGMRIKISWFPCQILFPGIPAGISGGG
jgi:hypothetical protein